MKEILRVAKQMPISKFLQFLAISRSALAVKENSILWKVLKISYLKFQAPAVLPVIFFQLIRRKLTAMASN